MYGFMVLLSTVVSLIFLSDGLIGTLEKIPYLCAKNETKPTGVVDQIKETFTDPLSASGLDVDCKGIVGFQAVYRIGFGMTLFFLAMMLIMCGVRSSKDPRAAIQRGFWAFKFLIVIGAIIGAFFLPPTFASTWMIFGLIGGFVFILIQLILIVDFAHGWAESWIEAYEETDNKCYQVGLIGVAFGCYAGLWDVL